MTQFTIPGIDISKDKGMSALLDKSIEAFSELCDIPVTFFDANHQIAKEYRSSEKICNIFNVYCDRTGPCRQNIASAGEFSSKLGEPYIFLCKSRLTNIAVALMVNGQFAGYYVAGPIIMGKLKNSVVENFSSLNGLDAASSAFAKMYADKMKTYDPTSVSRLSLLLFNSIIASISSNKDYQTLRSNNTDQNKINQAIQVKKRDNLPIEYPYDVEKDLIEAILAGQTDVALEKLEKLITTYSILSSGDLDSIKSNTLWLFAIIVRSAQENANNIEQVLDSELDIISRISQLESFTEVLENSKSIVSVITRNMLTSIYKGNSQVITRALRYINKNYKERITLKDIEENLNINASYFSTLFKHEMGVTFTDYLNSLKVQYACSLLENTNLSIIDVSLSAGFDDQSYFTKVFKKVMGSTPRAWKTEHSKK